LSLRELFLHKWIRIKKLRQSSPDWRKFMHRLVLGQNGFRKLVPFVDHTDARNATVLKIFRDHARKAPADSKIRRGITMD
jgi:hypothetical protein